MYTFDIESATLFKRIFCFEKLKLIAIVQASFDMESATLFK